MKQFTMRINKRCSVPPEAVYDLVADLRTHLIWGGEQQSGVFRLLSLDAPAGPATTGTSFTSTGSIPMASVTFEDRSQVTVAERPHTFEFVTHARVHRSRRPMEATYRHRYEITAAPAGSEISYVLTQLEISNPSLRLALPVVRTMTWRVGLPFMAGRGFRNLLAMAERGGNPERAALTTSQVDSR
jgi:hypothetical protein